MPEIYSQRDTGLCRADLQRSRPVLKFAEAVVFSSESWQPLGCYNVDTCGYASSTIWSRLNSFPFYFLLQKQEQRKIYLLDFSFHHLWKGLTVCSMFSSCFLLLILTFGLSTDQRLIPRQLTSYCLKKKKRIMKTNKQAKQHCSVFTLEPCFCDNATDIGLWILLKNGKMSMYLF